MIRDWSGTRWTMDARERFRINMPDEELERLGVTLGLNASHQHVEVVLSGYVLQPNRTAEIGDLGRKIASAVDQFGPPPVP